MIQTTKDLFVKIIANIRNQKLNHSIDNTVNSSNSERSKNVNPNQVDKIYFQNNSLTASQSIDCGSKKTNSNDQINQKLNIDCSQNTIWQIEKLSRYFEINENVVVSRGLWMLNVVRECEISNRKIAIVTLDKNNVVVDIAPINIV
jgi:hypothetical protein